MLKIYDMNDSTNVIPFYIDDDKRYVTHKFNGRDTLTFEMASNDPLYEYIAEEVKIEDEKNRYVIKNIDEHSDFVVVTCDLDLDDWKQMVYIDFRTTNRTLEYVVSSIIPLGWSSYGLGQFTQRTTVEGQPGQPLPSPTPLEILDAAAKAYSCVFNFDVIHKRVEAIDTSSFTPTGEFFTDELNLKSLGFVGKSYDFATRLYAYGKRDENGTPLTFADINGGKPYVEDFTYSRKIISVGWSDERYTNAETLLEDAKAKLKQLCQPTRSYSCDAKNLNDSIWMYKVVTLIDRRRKIRVNHQVVEYKEYPDNSLDVITLSTIETSIQSVVSQTNQSTTQRIEELAEESSKEMGEMQKSFDQAISDATSKITGNKGGHFLWVFDDQGRPLELLNLCDSNDISTAKSIWRWNAAGLGHSNNGYEGPYGLALLDDGTINAEAIKTGILNANIIKAGILRSVDEGVFYLDLEKGILKMNATDFTIGSKSVEDISKEANSETAKEVAELKIAQGEIKTNVENMNGDVSNLKQTAGQVSVSVGTPKGTLKTIINATQWLAQLVTANGEVISGLAFDFEMGQFLFNGSGKFTGEINVNDRFRVTPNGDVEAKGNTLIYGGKYYALDDDGSGGYTAMDKEGFIIYDSMGNQMVKVGFPSGNSNYPYVFLHANGESQQAGLFKRFADGIWLGNSAPMNEGGDFMAKEGYNGFFVSFVDNKAYVVAGTNMQSLYSGEAVAKFG